MSRKIFAVGDIHGCYDKLTAMMKILPWSRENGDLLLFIGDYIDRGPRSRDVVEYLVQLRKKGGEFVFLKGNHEKMLLDYYIQQKDQMLYVANGGAETIASYVEGGIGRKAFVLPEEHLDFFLSLGLYYQTEDYIFVHAGLRDNIKIAEQSEEDLLWIREEFIYSAYDWNKRVIFGHTALETPFVTPSKIGIDTGAVYGNKLTAVELPRMKFYQV
ncbi:metallophosphoesterase family protein [Desulfomonile tiedjei]|uniref:Putative phosphohydrolase n=1 Tax=Desulfomonile tiedjei (strain ATCC 49306 / DSM 6799 / DCB-1) TaxID=706587 RepID=I4C158_DESTA|nr:metallophosphoesterase family protein [Desulfomonile tiedjei]AFM23299.1 putative phosphohydrolase [Desulfomonile tiedjei DSM 6799]